jgi:SAM-dependent methyltransferase
MESSRRDRLESFVSLLKSERRHAVLGLDCGAGTDGLQFVRSGIHFTGVDLSEESIHAARAHGLEASVAGPESLPFADDAFSSIWAVDALSGLPPERWDDVVRELGRVAEPGAPIAVVLPVPAARSEDDSQDHNEDGSQGDSRDDSSGDSHGEGFTVLRSPA